MAQTIRHRAVWQLDFYRFYTFSCVSKVITFILLLYFTELWDFSDISACKPCNRSKSEPHVHVRVCARAQQTTSAQSHESPRPVREPLLTSSEKSQVRVFGKHSTVKHSEPREREGLLHDLTIIRCCCHGWFCYVICAHLQKSIWNSRVEVLAFLCDSLQKIHILIRNPFPMRHFLCASSVSAHVGSILFKIVNY